MPKRYAPFWRPANDQHNNHRISVRVGDCRALFNRFHSRLRRTSAAEAEDGMEAGMRKQHGFTLPGLATCLGTLLCFAGLFYVLFAGDINKFW
jgi:hypothetical protein